VLQCHRPAAVDARWRITGNPLLTIWAGHERHDISGQKVKYPH